MAATFIAISSVAYTTGSSSSVNAGATLNVQTDDVLFGFWNLASDTVPTATFSDSSGNTWTKLERFIGSNYSNRTFDLWWCRVASNNSALQVSVGQTGGSIQFWNGAVLQFRGIPNTKSPTLINWKDSNGTNPTSNSFTTTEADSLVVGAAIGLLPPSTPGGSYTEALDHNYAAYLYREFTSIQTGVTFSASSSSSTNNSIGGLFIGTAGAAAPVLTTPVGTPASSTTATVGATTDTASGTLYVAVTTSATQPSVAQIKAGQDHTGAAAAYASSQAVSSTGAKTFTATALTAGLTYYAHLVHNATGGDSNRISSGAIYPGTWRPASDVTVTGWTLSGAASHAAAVNENTASDSEFSTSGALTSTPTVKILALDRSLPAGTYTVKVRPKLSAGSGFVRISLLDGSNVAQGTSADTAITSTFTNYAITVTTTGAATRIREEYWI